MQNPQRKAKRNNPLCQSRFRFRSFLLNYCREKGMNAAPVFGPLWSLCSRWRWCWWWWWRTTRLNVHYADNDLRTVGPLFLPLTLLIRLIVRLQSRRAACSRRSKKGLSVCCVCHSCSPRRFPLLLLLLMLFCLGLGFFFLSLFPGMPRLSVKS